MYEATVVYLCPVWCPAVYRGYPALNRWNETHESFPFSLGPEKTFNMNRMIKKTTTL